MRVFALFFVYFIYFKIVLFLNLFVFFVVSLSNLLFVKAEGSDSCLLIFV